MAEFRSQSPFELTENINAEIYGEAGGPWFASTVYDDDDDNNNKVFYFNSNFKLKKKAKL